MKMFLKHGLRASLMLRVCIGLGCGACAAARWLVLGMLWLAPVFALRADNPSFAAPPLRVNPAQMQLRLTSCSDTASDYIVQFSYDLTNWTTGNTYQATGTGQVLVATAPATSSVCFYRLVMVPHVPIPLFGFAVCFSTNFNGVGRNFLIDSFDSSNTNYSSAINVPGFTNTVWVYDPAKPKADGDVATDSLVTGAIFVGNGTINGHIHTGLGSSNNAVQLGPHGTVGDLAWSLNNSGIEGEGTATNWWQPDCAAAFPDVKTPTFSGMLLPPVTTTGAYAGFIVIPQTGVTNYVSNTDPGKPLYITGPTTLWVKGSLALGVTIAPTNNASLTLYVGTVTGAGDSLILSGMGTLNQPGYARNLKIYGLPSLNSADLIGNAGWTATLYIPDAFVNVGAGGTSTQDTTGAIVCRGLILKGRWSFHYDESLKLSGPFY